jgi:RNA polymerase sigma factor (TIGR02999 family)
VRVLRLAIRRKHIGMSDACRTEARDVEGNEKVQRKPIPPRLAVIGMPEASNRTANGYNHRSMSDVTRILLQVESGDPSAAEELLPLVYDELRKLAAARLAQEKPGQTLQATALVHEAYLRLVDVERAQQWDSRGHFFAAAAEAMRRILVERARQKGSAKRGAGGRRLDLDERLVAPPERSEELLGLDAALTELEKHDLQAAQLVKLRYFAGLSHQHAAEMLGITRRAADRLWLLARTWLYRQISHD